MSDCLKHHVSLSGKLLSKYNEAEPRLGEGALYGDKHDIVHRIHPTKSHWMKSYCVEGKHWYRHKSRYVYCRRCDQWMLGIKGRCEKKEVM